MTYNLIYQHSLETQEGVFLLLYLVIKMHLKVHLFYIKNLEENMKRLNAVAGKDNNNFLKGGFVFCHKNKKLPQTI